MKIIQILEAIGDEDDLLEQLIYADASKVTELYNIMSSLSANFTLVPDLKDADILYQLKIVGSKMFLYREKAIQTLGDTSSTVKKINIVLEYIKTL